jgi:hypothetical protein
MKRDQSTENSVGALALVLPVVVIAGAIVAFFLALLV